MTTICPFPKCKYRLKTDRAIREHYQNAHQDKKFTGSFKVSDTRGKHLFSDYNGQIIYVETSRLLSNFYFIIVTCLAPSAQEFPCNVKITSENGQVLLNEAIEVCTYQQFQAVGNLSKFTVVFNIPDNEDFIVEIKPSVEILSNVLVRPATNPPCGSSSSDRSVNEPKAKIPKLNEPSNLWGESSSSGQSVNKLEAKIAKLIEPPEHKRQPENKSSILTLFEGAAFMRFKLTATEQFVQYFILNNQMFYVRILPSDNAVNFKVSSVMGGLNEANIYLNFFDHVNKTTTYRKIKTFDSESFSTDYLMNFTKDDILIFGISVSPLNIEPSVIGKLY